MENPENAGLQFPCDFPLKIIGHNAPDFMEFAIDLVRTRVPWLMDEDITSRESSGGKYLSISMTFFAIDRQQVDQLYEAMTEHKDRILFAL